MTPTTGVGSVTWTGAGETTGPGATRSELGAEWSGAPASETRATGACSVWTVVLLLTKTVRRGDSPGRYTRQPESSAAAASEE